MRKIVASVSLLLLSVSTLAAADDPIAVRKALMQANAASAGIASAMLKGELDYSPAVAKAAIANFHAVAAALGDFFPEGSHEGETRALPNIWQEADAFSQELGAFQQDADAAFAASGRNGPADIDAFRQAVGPVLQHCGSCHEKFRAD